MYIQYITHILLVLVRWLWQNGTVILFLSLSFSSHLSVPALGDTVDEGLLGEGARPVHRLPVVLRAPGRCTQTGGTASVHKHEIFDRSDFHYFHTIKSLWEGDFGVLKKNLKIIRGSFGCRKIPYAYAQSNFKKVFNPATQWELRGSR
jgi:hypothetical protein